MVYEATPLDAVRDHLCDCRRWAAQVRAFGYAAAWERFQGEERTRGAQDAAQWESVVGPGLGVG